MKIKLLLGLALSTLLVINVSAQNNTRKPVAKKKAVQAQKLQAANTYKKTNMAQAVKFLKRTNKVIVAAHEKLKTGKNHSGNFAKAVHHQRYAKKLLKLKKTHRAIQHSRVARKYAMLVIRENKGTYDGAMNINAEEKVALGTTISDAELEKDLKTDNPNINYDDSKITDKELKDMEVLEMSPADYQNK